MKITILLSSLVILMSCSNQTESNSKATQENKSEIRPEAKKEIKPEIDSTENQIQSTKVIFEKYNKDGIVLIGKLKLFDPNFNQIGKLEIKENSKVKILEKSIALYNIDKNKELCFKSNFIKIDLNGKNYIVFGQEVYQINEDQNIDFQDEQEQKYSIFPITNFEMGASGDDGSTGCDDYSFLIILDKTNKKYWTIGTPKQLQNDLVAKFANLIHDNGSSEDIYSVNVFNDSIKIGIKISYQEGYGAFILNTSLKDNFANSVITNLIRFDEENKYKQLK